MPWHATPVADRFWQKVILVDDSHSCWEWQGYRQKRGYGIIGEMKRQILTHRCSWALTYGPVPDGKMVLHHCDNPPCVRPNHLFLGSQKDNSDDMIAKGRNRQPRGENSAHAVLTEDDVRSIRAWVVSGAKMAEVATLYGVSLGCICHIIAGRSWRHI
jgi:hypothetical protein